MKYLLDTHILLWAASEPGKLSKAAQKLIGNLENTLYFSVASLWEISIKNGLGRTDFSVDPGALRRGLLDNGYEELGISGLHAVAVNNLPSLHKDPFDRMLIAQAQIEGITLITADGAITQYKGPIKKV
jgi:PIN domain nuclease of toxin-antitoxin system